MVYFEGFLGDIEDFSIINGGLLEIKGVNGVFRLDFSEEDLKSFHFGKHDNFYVYKIGKGGKNERE